jgi:hypothetical protein
MLSGITILAVMLTVFSGCYQEVELDPRQPGDLALVAGAYNVRDLGGYTAAEGRTVKTGKLFRSGDLNLLTSRDQNYLFNEVGIKTVVDFRGKKAGTSGINATLSERASSPDRWEGDPSADTAIEESLMIGSYEDIIQATDTPDEAADKMKDGYVALLTGGTNALGERLNARDQYKAFFTELLQAEGKPVLYHCSAGKDRTGIATMLLLAALGVDKETIIQDYLLSAQYVAEKYYPVVPYVTKSTGENMKAQRDSVQQAAAALNSGISAYVDPVKDGIKVGINNGIEERVIASVKAGLVDAGHDIDTVNAMSEDALDEILVERGQPSIEQSVSGAKILMNYDDVINSMVDAQADQIINLAAMTDAAIDGYALLAGQKVARLVTVEQAYIEAVFDALDTKYTKTGIASVLAFLKDETNGLGLSTDDITKLQQLYLE